MRAVAVALVLSLVLTTDALGQVPPTRGLRALHCRAITDLDVRVAAAVSHSGPADARRQLEESRLFEQEAELLDIDVTVNDVDVALTNVARQNGLELAGLQAAIRGEGFELGAYRLDVRRQILRLRVLHLLLAPPSSFALRSDLAPHGVPGATTETERATNEQAAYDAIGLTLVARMRERTAAAGAPGRRESCHESWPIYHPQELRVAGATVEEQAGVVATVAASVSEIVPGPAGVISPAAAHAIQTFYRHRGREVWVHPVREDGGVLWIEVSAEH